MPPTPEGKRHNFGRGIPSENKKGGGKSIAELQSKGHTACREALNM
jgi:hypothetical protein